MSDILVRIKRAVIAGHYAFSAKARDEMEADRLMERDVAEAILNAVAIYKIIPSRSPHRSMDGEKLYIIQGTNLEGLSVYTKGKLVQEDGVETYYFLVSSKRAT
jgi:hypothetical protein